MRKRGQEKNEMTFVIRRMPSIPPKYFKSVAESAICFSIGLALHWNWGSNTTSSRTREMDKIIPPDGGVFVLDVTAPGNAQSSMTVESKWDPERERRIFAPLSDWGSCFTDISDRQGSFSIFSGIIVEIIQIRTIQRYLVLVIFIDPRCNSNSIPVVERRSASHSSRGADISSTVQCPFGSPNW